MREGRRDYNFNRQQSKQSMNVNVRPVRLRSHHTRPFQPYIQPLNEDKKTELSLTLIELHLDSKKQRMRASEITTSSAHTSGSNECKRTCCLFSTTPHPAVAAIHSSNKRPKINEVLSLPLIAVIKCIQAAKQCMRARCIVTRLHAYYMEHQ